tara:strand:- start:40 stop:210 length:171 start_codon:yes stop_codon:yes gene_type:complete
MKYEVMASETVIYRIPIEAESEDEAIEKAWEGAPRFNLEKHIDEYDGFQIDKVRLK